MSFQFREPCTRSLRHWTLFKLPFISKVYISKPFLQGTPFKSISRYNSTSIIEKPISFQQVPKIKSSKKKAAKVWAKYEETYLKSKETLDTNQYEILMTTLLDKATHGTKTGFWARIIQAYEESKLLEINTSPIMYLAAIKAYGRSRNKLKVTMIFKEFKKRYLLKSSCYGIYFNALIDCGELTMAKRVLQEIQYNPCINRIEVSIYISKFIELCMKRNNQILAIETIESHYGFEWDKESLLNVLGLILPIPITPLSIESYLYNLNSKIIPSHIFTLFDLVCKTENFVPTIESFNILLKIQGNTGNFKRLKLLIDYMKEFNMKPTIETIEILKDVLKIDHIDDDDADVYKVCLDIISKKEQENVVKLKGFIERNEFENIGLNWIDKNGINLNGYSLVLEYWINQGEWNKCIIEFNRLENNTSINQDVKCIQLKLISLFANGKDWMYCENILNQYRFIFNFKNTGYNIINSLLSLKSKRGQSLVGGENIIKCIELIEKKLNIEFSSQEISKIIIKLGKRGDIENGYKLYNYVRSIKGERCISSSIYRGLMNNATRNNDLRRLERAWIDMQYRERFNNGNEKELKQEHDLKMYNILLNGFASRLPRPDLNLVRKFYQRMLSQKMIPDIVTYNILIKAFVNANNMEAANQIFKKMIESNIEPDNYSTNTILNGWIIRKDWNHVENFVKELNNTTYKLDIVTFNLLVQSFLQLDSKTMNYTHLLKNQNKWKHIDQLEESSQNRDVIKMSTEKIWSIFESTTGYKKELQPQQQEQEQEQNSNAFIKLFSNTNEPDDITYKLFMKAFDNIGDIKSSKKVYRWMKYRLEKQRK